MRVALLILTACGRFNFDARIDGGDASGDAASHANFVFVTSTEQLVCEQGIAAADALCMTRASAAGRAGTYIAWMSTPQVDARDRFGAARGWVRVDGKPFGDSMAGLIAGDVFYPARLDELGNDLGHQVVESATDLNGVYEPANGCTLGGVSSAGGRQWGTGILAGATRHILCFGIDQTFPLTVMPTTGRRAFVTVGSFNPGAGIATADARCATEATMASLPGSYLAFLPTTTVPAASRFNTVGPVWVESNGIPIVAQASDITTWNLIAPIAHRSDGPLSIVPVWTGSSPTSPTAASTCNNWSSNAPDGFDTRQAETAAYGGNNTYPCVTPLPVYCLQQ